MKSERPILCVCLLTGKALALAMAGQSSDQSYSAVTEAPFGSAPSKRG